MGTGSHNEDIAIATTTRLQGMVTTALNRDLASTILTNYPGPHTSECIATLTTQQRRQMAASPSVFRGDTKRSIPPWLAVCFLPAVTSGLAARSTKCHRLAATMHGIDELVAPTTPTYVSRLYLTTHSTIRTGFVSTGRDSLTRNSYHHFCKTSDNFIVYPPTSSTSSR